MPTRNQQHPLFIPFALHPQSKILAVRALAVTQAGQSDDEE